MNSRNRSASSGNEPFEGLRARLTIVGGGRVEADDKPAWHKGDNDGGRDGESKVGRGQVE